MKYRICERCGGTLDFGERCDCGDVKHVSYKEWEEAGDFTKAAKVGDLVDEAIVDEMMNNLPPATLRADLMQVGEPYSHRLDEKTGKWRPTFMTFKRSERGWVYCGNCFIGETAERGKDPVYA